MHTADGFNVGSGRRLQKNGEKIERLTTLTQQQPRSATWLIIWAKTIVPDRDNRPHVSRHGDGMKLSKVAR
jgi:hypothetical protein